MPGKLPVLIFLFSPAMAAAPVASSFEQTVRPFVESYCAGCHSGANPAAQLDLRAYRDRSSVVKDFPRWMLVLDKLNANQMPPKSARQPDDADRRKIAAWIAGVRREEARKHAGDPGEVLARRLNNAEYNYTIRDLTGVDIRPTREFPVDPANPAGFDNSGESLDMSPALMNKYLQAARDVANHMVLEPGGVSFASYLVLAETDRDKYCVSRIVDFYHRQDTDLSDYFQAAWRYKHRAILGKPAATLSTTAADSHISSKYLALIWRTLEGAREPVGPLAALQEIWRDLPSSNVPDAARPACDRMRDYVTRIRNKISFQLSAGLAVPGTRATAQPFIMWRNRQYATHRLSYDPTVLQVEGEYHPEPQTMTKARKSTAADNADVVDDEVSVRAPQRSTAPDPDLHVPAAERARFEAAYDRFAAVFPDAFYVQERGRYFPDMTRDKGRFLSAGFHNLMGYFRDDAPLYDLILDEKGRKQLDELWHELDFVASANIRTYTQFYLFESGEAKAAGNLSPGAILDITSDRHIRSVEDHYLAKARAANNPQAIKAVQDFFESANAGIRQVERARVAAEPAQLNAMLNLAARAWRRPLTPAERTDLTAYYHGLREKDGLSHEDALRDSVVSILMSISFCYRVDLAEAGRGSPTVPVAPLSDFALASRLSYFLWSSMPDKQLLAHAAAGDLHLPQVIAAEARRMLKDDRAQALATEFGGNWLDFRRFEEHNAVDRERFPSFTNDLREAMFQEPVRFLADLFRTGRPLTDLVYADYTFVNPVLAAHYGIPGVSGQPDQWVRVDGVNKYGRGGLLPMAVFLTKNAPGLRTSPVKRGYWVVRRVLGETIPPPPAVVPELPRDEAKAELPLRDLLARHRQDATCASCHARFDSFGLALEAYGPVGEARNKDLAGRPIDMRAEFPGGKQGQGLEGLRDYIRAQREVDFVENVCRKMLVYALGRSLILSDDITIDEMRRKLAANGNRSGTLIESIVTSPQFLNKRGNNSHEQKTD